MVKIIFVKDSNGAKIGEIRNYSDKAAKNAINLGFAQYVKNKNAKSVQVVQVESSSASSKEDNSDTTTNVTNDSVQVVHQLKDKEDNKDKKDNLDKIDNLVLCKETKQKIILLCIQNKTIKEISNVLDINGDSIVKIIKRKVGDTHKGLESEGYIKQGEKKGHAKTYITTQKGYDLIQSLIDNQKQVDYNDMIKTKQAEKLKEYQTKVQLYLNDLYLKDLEVTHSKHVYLDFIEAINENPELGERIEDDFTESIDMCKQIIKGETNRNIDITLKNVPDRLLMSIQKLDYTYFDKLIVIEGMIKGRSDRRPKVTSSQFECCFCGDIKRILQTEKHLRIPKKCDCGKTYTHMPNRDELVSVQSLELEEFSENLKGVNEPRNIRLILHNSLCSASNQKNFNPGMRLKFWGTLKRDWSFDNNRKKTVLDHYFEVNGYEVLDQTLEFNVDEQDKKKILDFIKKPDFFDIISKSFCPHIVGNNNIKKALLLAAVKGMKQLPFLNRDRIHILLVSNPGQGKTVMVKKLTEITPYSRFTSGLNSSKAGLTASVVKDEFLGGWRLSAGAVPLANNGICVIDEMDKFHDDDKKSLNSVMEEGEVVIDKATVHQKLKANTVIIANCNPTNEKFDDMTPRMEQLNLPRSLIDRFDLIFVLENKREGNPFLESIEQDYSDLLSENFISKFLIMAINNKPTITKPMMKYIAEISYNLQKGYNDLDFGYRQHNALFRLCFGFAKINFHKEVTKEDIILARDILISSYETLNIYFNGVLI